MANWPAAIQHLLKIEGGYVDDANDPGGATNYGISLRFLHDEAHEDHTVMETTDYDHNGDITADDIRHLTVDAATVVYKYAFWNPGKFDNLSDAVALKALDMAVNMGIKSGNQLIQRALNSFSVRGQNYLPGVDGDLGPQTIMRYNIVMREYGEEALLTAIRNQQETKYNNLIAANPKLEKFRKGWMNRVHSC